MSDLLSLLPYAFILVTGTLGYFLKTTMTRLDKASDLGVENKNEINLLQLEIKHTNSKVDEIFVMLKEISTDIKEINKSITKK